MGTNSGLLLNFVRIGKTSAGWTAVDSIFLEFHASDWL